MSFGPFTIGEDFNLSLLLLLLTYLLSWPYNQFEVRACRRSFFHSSLRLYLLTPSAHLDVSLPYHLIPYDLAIHPLEFELIFAPIHTIILFQATYCPEHVHFKDEKLLLLPFGLHFVSK
jgi:hypothetical protein